MQDIFQEFLSNLKQTTLLEYIAVIAGIASVWFSKKEDILVYPVGLINTIIYVYLSIKGVLFGEASVNFYYTVMSVYGWVLWTRRNKAHQIILHIRYSSSKEWVRQILFFSVFYIAVFSALVGIKKAFDANTIPVMDAFASATAFTGMWLMAKKRVESWYWWIATNITSIPLYFIKGYVLTSIYYIILLILAVAGLVAWQKKAHEAETKYIFETE